MCFIRMIEEIKIKQDFYCSVDFGLNLEAEFCELRLTGLEEQNAVKCHSWRRGRDWLVLNFKDWKRGLRRWLNIQSR